MRWETYDQTVKAITGDKRELTNKYAPVTPLHDYIDFGEEVLRATCWDYLVPYSVYPSSNIIL